MDKNMENINNTNNSNSHIDRNFDGDGIEYQTPSITNAQSNGLIHNGHHFISSPSQNGNSNFVPTYLPPLQNFSSSSSSSDDGSDDDGSNGNNMMRNNNLNGRRFISSPSQNGNSNFVHNLPSLQNSSSSNSSSDDLNDGLSDEEALNAAISRSLAQDSNNYPESTENETYDKDASDSSNNMSSSSGPRTSDFTKTELIFLKNAVKLLLTPDTEFETGKIRFATEMIYYIADHKNEEIFAGWGGGCIDGFFAKTKYEVSKFTSNTVICIIAALYDNALIEGKDVPDFVMHCYTTFVSLNGSSEKDKQAKLMSLYSELSDKIDKITNEKHTPNSEKIKRKREDSNNNNNSNNLFHLNSNSNNNNQPNPHQQDSLPVLPLLDIKIRDSKNRRKREDSDNNNNNNNLFHLNSNSNNNNNGSDDEFPYSTNSTWVMAITHPREKAHLPEIIQDINTFSPSVQRLFAKLSLDNKKFIAEIICNKHCGLCTSFLSLDFMSLGDSDKENALQQLSKHGQIAFLSHVTEAKLREKSKSKKS
ncbi:MAG: hypothetical protein LBI81_01555 [Puniceicoccales bacterium]|jgi:hypothetical protein|nr:hypothetical protein [Puniceicoccales bacterium]